MTYDLTGPKHAPALVFLHAASYTRKMWLPQTRALQGEFRILAVDLPAHGARADTPFTFAASVQAVADAMDDADISRALLVGASLGGCVAALFAAAHPDKVTGLVLSGSTFDARSLDQPPRADRRRLGLPTRRGPIHPRLLRAHSAALPGGCRRDHGGRDTLARRGSGRAGHARSGLRRCLRPLPRPDADFERCA